MRFGLAKEHLDFFYQNHYIEFEQLLSKKDVQSLKKEIKKILAIRLNTQEGKLKNHPFPTLYSGGFDTWRESDSIKRILLSKHLAEVAAQLVKKDLLRIGFDQIFYTPSIEISSSSSLKKTFSLPSSFCLQGIACGLILHLDAPLTPLDNPQSSLEKDEKDLITIPHLAGNGIFFSPSSSLSLEPLMTTPGIFQVLIIYAEKNALYSYSENHIHTHQYKKFGYVFGDRLENSTHPILYKR